jgi:hypothetical protein
MPCFDKEFLAALPIGQAKNQSINKVEGVAFID